MHSQHESALKKGRSRVLECPEVGIEWFYLHVHAWQKCYVQGDIERARTLLNTVLSKTDVLELGDHERVQLSQGVFRILGDRDLAARLVQAVPQPPLATPPRHHEEGFAPFYQRLRLNRLLYALGTRSPLTDIVPDATEDRDRGMVVFERHVCLLARLWGEAWAGRRLPATEVIRQADPVLRLFHRSVTEKREWTSWYYAERARGELYKLLVEAVAQHGPEAVEYLRNELELEWDNARWKHAWPPEVQRRVVLRLWQLGVAREWVMQRLSAIEPEMLEGHDLSGRLQEYRDQAEAWASPKISEGELVCEA